MKSERYIVMKKTFKLLACAAAVLMCMSGCSNIPEEPATTGTAEFTYKNAIGETVPVAENLDDYPGITQPPKHIETVHSIRFVQRSYYVYGNTVASVNAIELENMDIPQATVYGRAKATIIGKGKEDYMKIAYNAYDVSGNLLKENGCMSISIDGKKDGEAVEMTFGVPAGTAKVEFYDYTKK